MRNHTNHSVHAVQSQEEIPSSQSGIKFEWLPIFHVNLAKVAKNQVDNDGDNWNHVVVISHPLKDYFTIIVQLEVRIVGAKLRIGIRNLRKQSAFK